MRPASETAKSGAGLPSWLERVVVSQPERAMAITASKGVRRRVTLRELGDDGSMHIYDTKQGVGILERKTP